MQVDRVEVACLLELVPVDNLEGVALQEDQAIGSKRLQNPVDVNIREPGRIGELALGDWDLDGVACASPTAFIRTISSQRMWAMRE